MSLSRTFLCHLKASSTLVGTLTKSCHQVKLYLDQLCQQVSLYGSFSWINLSLMFPLTCQALLDLLAQSSLGNVISARRPVLGWDLSCGDRRMAYCWWFFHSPKWWDRSCISCTWWHQHFPYFQAQILMFQKGTRVWCSDHRAYLCSMIENSWAPGAGRLQAHHQAS